MLDKKSRAIAWFVVAALVLTFLIFGWTIWYSSTVNDGRALERNISSLQRQAADSVSKCLEDGRTSMRVSGDDFRQVKQTLLGVAVTRTDQLGGEGLAASSLRQTPAPVEAATWKVLLGVASGCRRNVDGTLNEVKQAAVTLNMWRQSGNLFEELFRNDLPTNSLTAVDPRTGERLHGMMALEALVQDVPALK